MSILLFTIVSVSNNFFLFLIKYIRIIIIKIKNNINKIKIHISKKFWGIASINNLIDVEFVSFWVILLDNWDELLNVEFILFV